MHLPVDDPPPAAPPRPHPAWGWAVLALLALSALQAALLLLGGALHGNDFKHLWAGAWLLAHGLNPYEPETMFRAAQNFRLGAVNPFVYLPSTGWLLWPLTRLRPEAAKLAWFGFNWLLAWGCVLAGPRWLRVPRPWAARVAGGAFLCAAFPFYRQMTAGQMNVVTAALLLGAAGLLLRRRDGWAGAVLAVAFAWKITPILLLAALFVLRRGRAAAVGAAGCLAVLLALFAVTPFETLRAAFATLGEMGYGRSTWAQFGMDFYRDPFNQSVNALLHHLFTENPHARPWHVLGPAAANQLTLIVTLLLGLAWLLAVWAQLPHRRAAGVEPMAGPITLRLFWAAVVLMLLAPSLLWDHYVTQLLPVVLWWSGVARWRGAGVWLALVVFAALCVPWLHGAPLFRGGWGVPLMSVRLWPLLALYAALLWTRMGQACPSESPSNGVS